MADKDYPAAKEAYQKILDRTDPRMAVPSARHAVNWKTYTDTVLRFAQACAQLNDSETAKKTIEHLLGKSPPLELIPQIRLFHACLIGGGAAYAEMQEVAALFPPRLWSGKERSLFHALQYNLDKHYDRLLQQASQLRIAGCHEGASSFYKEVLEGVEKKIYPKACFKDPLIEDWVRFRLAESLFEIQKEKANEHTPSRTSADPEMLFRAASLYRQLLQFSKTLETYKKTNGGDHFCAGSYIFLELGLFYYCTGNWDKAKDYLHPLISMPYPGSKAASLGTLYLARILLHEKQPLCAEEILAPLASVVPLYDPQRYELTYLRGKAAYQLENYEAAACFFEKSIPPGRKGIWIHDALLHLALSYLKLDDPACLKKAIPILKALKPEEQASLALAYCLLTTNEKEMFSNIFCKEIENFSLNGKHEGLLLLAGLEDDAERKEFFYEQASDRLFIHAPSYPESLLLHGLHHFQQWMDTGDCLPFQKAAESFASAFHCYEMRGRQPSESIFITQAILEKRLDTLDCSLPHKESLFVNGMLGVFLEKKEWAESRLLEFLADHPQDILSDQALYALASLYYKQGDFLQAKAYYCRLASSFLQSPLAASSWFWAAEAAEKLGGPAAEIKRLRENVYQRYPHAQIAGEAFFKQFTPQQYHEGGPLAMEHLKQFPQLFPDSPYLSAAYYLLGKHQTQAEKAKTAYEACLQAFCLANTHHSAHADFYFYRLHALLELSHFYKEDPAEAIHILQAILKEFENTEYNLKKNNYSLYEQVQSELAQAYLESGKEFAAQQVLANMLSDYKRDGISEGYYLSRMWQLHGRLARRCCDEDTALRCFDMAALCGEDFLSQKEKAALVLMKKQCGFPVN